jgi:HEAT repeat protein
MLDSTNAAVKSTAIDALQQLSDGASLAPIADLMAESDDMIRVAAINAAIELARKTDRMDVIEDRLRACLHGQTGRTARDLLGAAARSGRPGLWGPVSQFLRDPDPALRRSAAEALTVLASPESVDVITDRLGREDDSRTAVQLARATAILRSKVAVPTLINLLRSREDTVVQAASKALGAITREEFGTSFERWSEWWGRASAK